MLPDSNSEPIATPIPQTGAIPISPALEANQPETIPPTRTTHLGPRIGMLVAYSIVLGVLAGFIAEGLKSLIGAITNITFYHRLSWEFLPPDGNQLGLWVIAMPVIGGLIVGVMARFGSEAIRGHGIPEAMEKILESESRIPFRLTWLKPLSAAIAIGTGGPFGAEGPIIATGGAVGSFIGQCLRIDSSERKTLLAAGAAAGMAATFGSPVSAVLLAVELLLFEYRAASIIPVALASVAATGMHFAFEGTHPVFTMPPVLTPGGPALAVYTLLGALMGIAAVGVTRILYWIEDRFDHLPVHWMWWPAIGAIAVGVVGYFDPRTLGVGYRHISDILSARLTLASLGGLCLLKFISWSISLGSGTSGGTLAPLFIIGGALGGLFGGVMQHLFPGLGVDPSICALVGMAAMFAGASRALLASPVFAFETTLQPLGLLPLLGGCTAAYLVASLLMKESIMTEKIVRRGVRVPNQYHADPLDQIIVTAVATAAPVTVPADRTIAELHAWLRAGGAAAHHQGFPVINGEGHLIGVLTRRGIDAAFEKNPTAPAADLVTRPPVIIYGDCTVREAVDHMVKHDVGRLPVIERGKSGKMIGIITRGDILSAYRGAMKPPG